MVMDIRTYGRTDRPSHSVARMHVNSLAKVTAVITRGGGGEITIRLHKSYNWVPTLTSSWWRRYWKSNRGREVSRRRWFCWRLRLRYWHRRWAAEGQKSPPSCKRRLPSPPSSPSERWKGHSYRSCPPSPPRGNEGAWWMEQGWNMNSIGKGGVSKETDP